MSNGRKQMTVGSFTLTINRGDSLPDVFDEILGLGNVRYDEPECECGETVYDAMTPEVYCLHKSIRVQTKLDEILYDEYYGTIELTFKMTRMETEEDHQRRLDREKLYEANQQKSELKQLKVLAQKYGKTVT